MTTPLSSEDPEYDPEELDEAVNELPSGVHAPEVSEQTENLTEWDDPTDSTGHSVDKIPLEDETLLAEELVDDGIEAADSDQRIAAADPDLEP